uniref:Uncharacterized protein n=1 Tax=Ditylenchus dipsaci TaxID=166011 RepID=A0A915E291_9BILA
MKDIIGLVKHKAHHPHSNTVFVVTDIFEPLLFVEQLRETQDIKRQAGTPSHIPSRDQLSPKKTASIVDSSTTGAAFMDITKVEGAESTTRQINSDLSHFQEFVRGNTLYADTSGIVLKIVKDRLSHHLFVYPPFWLKTFNLSMMESLLSILPDENGDPYSTEKLNTIISTDDSTGKHYLRSGVRRTVDQLQARELFVKSAKPKFLQGNKEERMKANLGKHVVLFMDLHPGSSPLENFAREFTEKK